MAFEQILNALSNLGPGQTMSEVLELPDMPITREGFGNVVKGKAADLAGLPGDITGLAQGLLQVKQGRPIGEADFSSSFGTDAIGEALGADVESPEFIGGAFLGIPDMGDLAKLSGFIPAIIKKAKNKNLDQTFFHTTPRGNEIPEGGFDIGKNDGAYFTTDPEYSQASAPEFRSQAPDAGFEPSAQTGTVYPSKLDMQNPKVLGEKDYEKYADRGYDRQALIDEGYDGIILEDQGGVIEAQAFYPEQIKTATGSPRGLDRNTYLESTGVPNQYRMGDKEGITPLNIQMQNPLVADLDQGVKKPKKWETDLAEAFDDRNIDKKALMSEKHDGVIVKRPGGQWDYMTVSPGQINDRATDQLLQDALDFQGEDLAIGAKRAYLSDPNRPKSKMGDPNWHPISDSRMPMPYDEMTSVQRKSDDILLDELEQIQGQDMIGEWNLSSPWDRSSTGQVITEVNGKPLTNPVVTEGGRGHIQRPDTGILGSGEDVVRGYEKRARSTPAGSKVNVAPVAMSPTSSDFSTMVSEVHVNRLDGYEVSDDAKALFDKEMIEGAGNKKNKNAPQPNWPGLDDPDLIEKLNEPGMAGVRMRFLDLQDRAHHKKAGFPDVGSSRKAVEAEELRDVPTGWSGGTVGQWDLEQALMPSSHGSYPLDAPGVARGSLGKDLPLSVMQADAMARRRLVGAPETSDLRSVEMSKPIQEVTPELAQIMDVHPGFRRPGGPE